MILEKIFLITGILAFVWYLLTNIIDLILAFIIGLKGKDVNKWN